MALKEQNSAEAMPSIPPQYQRLDLFVRRFLGGKNDSLIRDELGPVAWRLILERFKIMQLVYIFAYILFVFGALGFVLLIASISTTVPISGHALVVLSMFMFPCVLLHTTRQEKRREEIEAGANVANRINVKRLFRLYRSISEGRSTILESQREIGLTSPAKVPTSYFTEDHGIVRLLRSEFKWASFKIGHRKRYSDEMVIDFTADPLVHAELIMVELCDGQRKRLSLSKTELSLIELDLKSKGLWNRYCVNAVEVLNLAIALNAEGTLMKVLIGAISNKLNVTATNGRNKGKPKDKTAYIRTVLEGRAAGKDDAFGKQMQKAIG
jgi:hypothetical protein